MTAVSLPVPAGRFVDRVRLSLLWLIGATGGFVLIEPAPWEFIVVLAMIVFFATGLSPPDPAWHNSPGVWTAERLRELGRKYGAEYVVALSPEIVVDGAPVATNAATSPPMEPPPLPDLPEVYRNRSYIVYRLH